MLNDRAREILAFIQRFKEERGYPPTIREIGKAFGISSTNGVRYYLNLLESAGHLKRSGKISRGIEGVSGAFANRARAGIPILGRVAAGQPILAEQSFDGSLDTAELFGDSRGLFALRVRGDSMIDAGILEGDYVVVLQQDRANAGDIVVGLVGDEATVKYFQPKRGHIELVAANPKYEPIVVDAESEFRILGIVRGVIRTVGK
ncbi:MAG TPA: transcriptional repressor LexA [Candidatus Sulfotelmatobacter sp.]|nr:transcriptional repressor LexA [Candidatus Sulfotelmatobacter sp.]